MSEETDLREPPVAGGEVATMIGELEQLRSYLAWKCGGLDSAGLQATLSPSSITLGGLLKHLALVEDEYFTRRLLGQRLGPPWDTVDWDADPDWEWHSAADDSRTSSWRCGRARSAGPAPRSRRRWPTGPGPPGRAHRIGWAVTEPAAHHDRPDRGVRATHRPRPRQESVDGVVGEDPDV